MNQDLNAKFAVGEALTFSPGEGGLTRAVIQTPACRAEVYLHGGHITRWQPAGHDEVLWLSQRANFLYDMPIRGGIPICFPWFAGNKPADRPNAPSHGYARTQNWQVADTRHTGQGVGIILATTIEDYGLTYHAEFGEALHLSLTVTNNADQPQTFEEALHTYFTVSQIKGIQVTGLEGAEYLHTVGGANTLHTQGDTPLTFDQETDRVYRSDAAVMLHDPGLGRDIHIIKGDSQSTVVWNPWMDKAAAMSDFGDDEWPGMVCIESGNITPHAVKLQANESHTMTTTIRVENCT
ncbi:MAG: D-hexose-6-phosphate mutarotase [Planctomycetota bacterium]